MSSSIPPLGPVVNASGPEEVLHLSCPECGAGLNLRRKHIGIAGSCLKCQTPVTARELDGVVTLMRTADEVPVPDSGGQPTTSVRNEETAAEAAAAEESHSLSGASSVEPPAETVSEGPATTPPPFPGQGKVGEPASEPKAPAESKWGFPDREEAIPEIPAPEAEAEAEDATEEDAVSPSLSAFMNSIPPDKLSGLETPVQEEAEKQSVSLQSGFPSIGVPGDEKTDLFGSGAMPNPGLQPDSAPEAGDDPVGSKAEASPFSDSVISLENDAMIPGGSSLFGNSGTTPVGGGETPAKEDAEAAGEMQAAWGTKVPTQNHASISPFADPSERSSGGFAETLFREKATGSAGGETNSPFGQPAGDSPGVSGALFANPGKPKQAAGFADNGEEVVLDGDGRPMKPMTDEEKDAFAKEMMQVGDYHTRSPWVRRITRCVATIVILAGVGYGAYVFTPEEKVKEWKNKTLNWLEPGTVLLDFLPFEITDVEGGEEGEKEIKIKAIEGLNNLTGEMDAYLDASEENLKETGAIVPEREEQEKMDMPNMPKIPKLPFNMNAPGQPGADAADTEEGQETSSGE